MSTFAILALVLATVAAMEGVAWASHKYILHGFGWAWHRDHHEPHGHRLEKNDRFALVGAAMSTSMFAAGNSARAIERAVRLRARSEEHKSELQSLMRLSSAVFCFQKKKDPLQERRSLLYHHT